MRLSSRTSYVRAKRIHGRREGTTPCTGEVYETYADHGGRGSEGRHCRVPRSFDGDWDPPYKGRHDRHGRETPSRCYGPRTETGLT